MKIIGIYKITSPTGKIYVGQSCNINKRWCRYKRLDCVEQIRLFNSLRFHKPNNHIFEIIEECKREELNNKERYYQDYYEVIGEQGLNCILTETDTLPRFISESTKEKLRNFNLGKKHTDETKIKMSRSHTGKKLSEDHISRIMKNKKIFKHTEETKLKIGISNKGKKRTIEQKEKFSEVRTGLTKKGRLIICTETNKIWDSIKKCAEENNFKYQWFKKVLLNKIRNKTTFKYYEE